MMRKIVSVLFVCFAFIQAASAQYDDKALAILDAMSEKYQKIPAYEANFIQALKNPQEEVNENFEGQITVKDEKFRLKMEGQEIINNGTTIWTYIPEVNEVNIDNYNPEEGEMTPSRMYSAYKEGFKYVYLEEKIIDGKTYDIIDLVPENKNDQFFKIRMVIGQEDKMLKGWTMFDKNGNRYVYQITNFNIKEDIPDAFFEFDKNKHAGVDVIDLR